MRAQCFRACIEMDFEVMSPDDNGGTGRVRPAFSTLRPTARNVRNPLQAQVRGNTLLLLEMERVVSAGR